MVTETAVFGGGCFWCTEAVLQQMKGVVEVTPGYAGGDPPAGGEGDEVVTELKQLEEFYPAEEDHVNFYNRNPGYGYSLAVINPKLKKIRERFRDLLKEKL